MVQKIAFQQILSRTKGNDFLNSPLHYVVVKLFAVPTSFHYILVVENGNMQTTPNSRIVQMTRQMHLAFDKIDTFKNKNTMVLATKISQKSILLHSTHTNHGCLVVYVYNSKIRLKIYSISTKSLNKDSQIIRNFKQALKITTYKCKRSYVYTSKYVMRYKKSHLNSVTTKENIAESQGNRSRKTII